MSKGITKISHSAPNHERSERASNNGNSEASKKRR
ncbi:Uncharacterised protein [Vibrio cholerae]|nr:Uncharacterised protein [Vibrio cholerae]